jgi:hypothetical protein
VHSLDASSLAAPLCFATGATAELVKMSSEGANGQPMQKTKQTRAQHKKNPPPSGSTNTAWSTAAPNATSALFAEFPASVTVPTNLLPTPQQNGGQLSALDSMLSGGGGGSASGDGSGSGQSGGSQDCTDSSSSSSSSSGSGNCSVSSNSSGNEGSLKSERTQGGSGGYSSMATYQGPNLGQPAGSTEKKLCVECGSWKHGWFRRDGLCRSCCRRAWNGKLRTCSQCHVTKKGWFRQTDMKCNSCCEKDRQTTKRRCVECLREKAGKFYGAEELRCDPCYRRLLHSKLRKCTRCQASKRGQFRRDGVCNACCRGERNKTPRLCSRCQKMCTGQFYRDSTCDSCYRRTRHIEKKQCVMCKKLRGGKFYGGDTCEPCYRRRHKRKAHICSACEHHNSAQEASDYIVPDNQTVCSRCLHVGQASTATTSPSSSAPSSSSSSSSSFSSSSSSPSSACSPSSPSNQASFVGNASGQQQSSALVFTGLKNAATATPTIVSSAASSATAAPTTLAPATDSMQQLSSLPLAEQAGGIASANPAPALLPMDTTDATATTDEHPAVAVDDSPNITDPAPSATPAAAPQTRRRSARSVPTCSQCGVSTKGSSAQQNGLCEECALEKHQQPVRKRRRAALAFQP